MSHFVTQPAGIIHIQQNPPIAFQTGGCKNKKKITKMLTFCLLMLYLCKFISIMHNCRGFFSPGGLGWSPPPHQQKFSLSPLNRPPSPLFDQSLSPQLSFVTKNIDNFTSFFSFLYNFDYFLTQNCIRFIENTKICSNFAVGGDHIFCLSRQVFKSSPPPNPSHP